jgi:dTDP-glucose 4,6-dehydratase
MSRVLLTGGCGFVGHYLAAVLAEAGHIVTILDKLTYASRGLERLRDAGLTVLTVPPPNQDDAQSGCVSLVTHDFVNHLPPYLEREIGPVDILLHVGGETHVDRSIDDAEPFVLSNVLGTMRMLELARRKNVKRFLYFSTDEVFGPAPAGTAFKENDRYNSGNPYAAAKAGGEELVVAYHNTHRVPAIITHTMNIFGERQLHEKFFPKVIRKVLDGETVTIHADKTRTVSGSRFYIHVADLCDAVLFLLRTGVPGEKYNIVGEQEVHNLNAAQMIAGFLGRELKYELVDFHSSRPGHDLRYALDGTKLRDMGWRHTHGFAAGLERTVKWYVDHPDWLRPRPEEGAAG